MQVSDKSTKLLSSDTIYQYWGLSGYRWNKIKPNASLPHTHISVQLEPHFLPSYSVTLSWKAWAPFALSIIPQLTNWLLLLPPQWNFFCQSHLCSHWEDWTHGRPSFTVLNSLAADTVNHSLLNSLGGHWSLISLLIFWPLHRLLHEISPHPFSISVAQTSHLRLHSPPWILCWTTATGPRASAPPKQRWLQNP